MKLSDYAAEAPPPGASAQFGTQGAAPFSALCEQMEAELAQEAVLSADQYAEIRKEVKGMQLPSSAAAYTLQMLSDQLAELQGYYDRVAELLADAQGNWILRKTVAELLHGAYMSESSAGSADKRKAEATLQTASYAMEAARAESLYRFLAATANKLESKIDTASRRISCLQSQIRIQDVGHSFSVGDIAPPRPSALANLDSSGAWTGPEQSDTNPSPRQPLKPAAPTSPRLMSW